MTPKQIKPWRLYQSGDDLLNSAMISWIEENNSLIERLNNKYQKIELRVISEEICNHDEEELNLKNAKGNLRKIFLSNNKNIVFAESFFSEEVIKKFNSFRNLKNIPLSKFLFSDPKIRKCSTYIALYKLDEITYQGRKCIYEYDGSKFSVIEVFLF